MQDIKKDGSFAQKKDSNLNTDQNKHHEIKTAFSDLSTSRRILVVSLAFFSIILFFFWGGSTKKRLSSPLNPDVDTEPLVSLNQSENNLLNADEDGDGLTDLEEENLYQTSPYLDDTDSDGVSDGDEVKNGSDPNCAEGQNCYQETIVNIDNQDSADLDNIGLSGDISDEELSQALSGKSSVETLREMLLEAGMQKEVLDSISDEDLLKSYQEVLQ
ncbi:hypothetical protein C0584_01405 [Candidatus Parcubacteria bacterium]|nr:MAG: hypothetical protein C0584_01405 [Candidatus Parcubacteria bacterium]